MIGLNANNFTIQMKKYTKEQTIKLMAQKIHTQYCKVDQKEKKTTQKILYGNQNQITLTKL